MAKATKQTNDTVSKEEQEKIECAEKINKVLAEYDFALVPYNQPMMKLVKVEKKDEETEKSE